jgi:hypothetical protein
MAGELDELTSLLDNRTALWSNTSNRHAAPAREFE